MKSFEEILELGQIWIQMFNVNVPGRHIFLLLLLLEGVLTMGVRSRPSRNFIRNHLLRSPCRRLRTDSPIVFGNASQISSGTTKFSSVTATKDKLT